MLFLELGIVCPNELEVLSIIYFKTRLNYVSSGRWYLVYDQLLELLQLRTLNLALECTFKILDVALLGWLSCATACGKSHVTIVSQRVDEVL